jgi:hypothetical protein
VTNANVAAAPTVVPPTTVPATPTVIVPTPTPAPLFADQLSRPLPGWPDNPQSTAWFSLSDYRMLARDSGRFVAVGVPLGKPVQDVRVSAQFHKVGGPAGGGYGLIVRDQSPATERDGRNQAGRYVVVEVGDRGDIGIWQREETHWIDIVPWQHSDAVRLDRQPNAITVTTHGTGLQFVVNGQTVAEASDNALPIDGGVGVFVGGDLNEVALETLRIDTTN